MVRSLLAAVALCWLAACGSESAEPQLEQQPEQRPVRSEVYEALQLDLAAPRHPADGGGRAWLEDPAAARVSTPGKWTLVYQAGEFGVAEGGAVFLQVSPFWGWSTPQVEDPTALGFTQVETEANVELRAETIDQQLLAVHIEGRALRAGEQVRWVYGAGAAGARADRYAEGESRFWIAVDGDGDGVRGVLADSPSLAVLPGRATRLIATLPSTARPGEAVSLRLAWLDSVGNWVPPEATEVRLSVVGDTPPETAPLKTAPLKTAPLKTAPPKTTLPGTVSFRPQDHGNTMELRFSATAPGIVRLRAETAAGLSTESNPMQVATAGVAVYWADLQNHSSFSDGTGTPEELLRYARDVAGLDVVSITDHDHWGMVFLDQDPASWLRLRQATEDFHQPGEFVTLAGYEWTHWVHGHRHVLFFGDVPEHIWSSVDERYDHPVKLWQALRGRRALTLAHHSAGGPIATDWSIPPDPEIEPVTEIVSVHGSSEAADSPRVIHQPVPGNFVRDALDRGYRLGFLGSSDGHDGHPGLGHIASASGGLAAILADELTRDGIYRALQQRRVYATNGPRILLRTVFAGHPMGAEIAVAEGGAAVSGPVPAFDLQSLFVQVIAPLAIARIDIVRSGLVVASFNGEEQRQMAFLWQVENLEPAEYLYVRVVQEDGGAAWSSPFFFVASAQNVSLEPPSADTE